jgi:3-mercaptopropionate dioxygenase
MAVREADARVRELIERLDAAVATEDLEQRCLNVKDTLHQIVESGADFIPDHFLRPAAECYARRLLHKDPEGRYSVVVMVWDVGQGTALHDHAGVWCVECVYCGQIKVVSYAHQGMAESPAEPGVMLHQFEREGEVFAGPSDAGALIPPFEHHTIENSSAEKAVTIHVYGGELEWCHAFLPTEGGYEEVRRDLCYTD